MLATADAALIIGDPALAAAKNADRRVFDLAGLWHSHTGLGFVFAMWMTRRATVAVDLVEARNEGLARIDEIASTYASEELLDVDEIRRYLAESIAYAVDDSMRQGMELYFELAAKNGLIERNKPVEFLRS
jgi:chorismate dehydratase